jgi:hypothetical protein
MKRVVAALAAPVLLAASASGVAIWLLTRGHQPKLPEISAYSSGKLVRVGPYFYCEVLDLNDCRVPQTVGELKVDARHPIQLSIPPAIARAPWVLQRQYEDGLPSLVEEFRPDSRLAVTIPTVDPLRGKLTNIVVQLPTLARDEAGNEFPIPHAEWSVRPIWP